MKSLRFLPDAIKALSLCALSLSLVTCGGGGGGDEPEINIKGADISVDAEPTHIGVGDRIDVSIHVSEVDENGVIVKVRMPKELRLVANSSFLTVDGDTVSVDPFEDSVGADGLRYMGYYFSRSSFDDDRRGKLSLQVRALSGPAEGDLEVDSDVHNPGKNADEEFSSRRSFFSREDQLSVKVE